jgi:very-short-patch-repair endonuclease
VVRNGGALGEADADRVELIDAMINRRCKLPRTSVAARRAKELRNDLTVAEAMLWTALKGSAMRGYDFHRQVPIGDYIVDFFCPRLMLAIEIDGDSHRDKSEYDCQRQTWIESLGVQFMRFDDLSVRRRMGDVLRGIEGWIALEEQKEAANHPPPLE